MTGHLNIDFEQRVVVETAQADWVPSPAAGIERKLLEREFAEHGRATSIVRYAPGSAFQRHEHPLGEEILVLEGVFSDDTGDYPAGSYLRNPPGSGHAPRSEPGCVLFVKLHQFDPRDTATVRINTRKQPWRPGIGGLQVMPLRYNL